MHAMCACGVCAMGACGQCVRCVQWAAHVSLVILPGLLITLASFLVFFSDTSSADALGYGIRVIVVNLLSNCYPYVASCCGSMCMPP